MLTQRYIMRTTETHILQLFRYNYLQNFITLLMSDNPCCLDDVA